MSTLFLRIGLLSLLLPAVASAAQNKPLYDQMKEKVEAEVAVKDVEKPVAKFIKALYKKKKIELTDEQLNDALKGKQPEACASKEGVDTFATCSDLLSTVQSINAFENRVRNAGRTFQLTATSYELPISDLPSRVIRTASDLRGIVSIWSAGTGSIKTALSGGLLRVKSADVDALRELVSGVGQAIEELTDEEKVAVIWRYQYGVRLAKGERGPLYPARADDEMSGPGTERQYLFKHWEDVETKLNAVWEEVADDTFDPPLSSNESVLYSFPASFFDETLPENVILWIRVDKRGDSKQPHPLGDVGLEWKTPLEPVLPALTKDGEDDEPILGGDYPPEPVKEESGKKKPIDGVGLCSGAEAQRGYLCRAFDPDAGAERCPESQNKQSDTITLTSCTPPEKEKRETLAGPDVCREVNYLQRAPAQTPFDKETECRVEVSCDDDCKDDAWAFAKDGNGIIKICLRNRMKYTVPAFHILAHELTHAYELCAEKPGTLTYKEVPDGPPEERVKILEENRVKCCRFEGAGNQAEYSQLEKDGGFAGVPDVDGIPLNAQTCAEATTTKGCMSDENPRGCNVSRVYTEKFFEACTKGVFAKVQRPMKCEDIVKTVDGKKVVVDDSLAQFVETIERRNDVCRIGAQSVYKNRIGNNICFAGQCIEESTERSRVVGGRSPSTMGDAFAPFDDPTTGTPLGRALVNPPVTQTFIPPYRPQLAMRDLEVTLCQLQGLPPLTPPILCAIQSSRRLTMSIAAQVEHAQSLLMQQQDTSDPVEALLRLSPGIGARIGTQLYASYLHEASRSFADILTMANRLFQEMLTVKFPDQMCPMNDALPTPPKA